MKVEIPQILWNCEDTSNKGLPTALMSLSLLPTTTRSSTRYCLATAGNCTDINIWSLEFPSLSSTGTPITVPVVPLDTDGKSDIGSSPTVRSHISPTTTSPPSINPSTSTSSPTLPKQTGTGPVVVTGIVVSASGATTSNATSNTTGSTNSSKTKIDFLCSLTRHEGPVNIVAFSPNGQHLASASDTGSIILWSVPSTQIKAVTSVSTSGPTFSFYWTNRYIQKEADLSVKIISSSSRADSIIDLSWSADSKRFVVGTIDHTIMIYEDIHYNTNHNLVTSVSSTTTSPPAPLQQQQLQPQPSEFKMIYRNASYHTHFIQGVAFDPLQVYVASQSSDRTVRVWQRKEVSVPGESSKKKNSNTSSHGITAMAHSKHNSSNNALATITTNTLHSSPSQPPLESVPQIVLHSEGTGIAATPAGTYAQHLQQKPLTKQHLHQLIMTKHKFELQIKTKQIKYRTSPISNQTTTTTTIDKVPDADMVHDTTATVTNENDTPTNTVNTQSKQYLFAAETTLESFVRRLKWTVDGAYLIVPAATWSFDNDNDTTPSINATTATSSAPSKFATLIYQRHKYDEPYKVLGGHDKPSIAVCPNPVLFKLLPPEQVDEVSSSSSSSSTTIKESTTTDETKENCNNLSTAASTTASSPPYRHVFAVLTWDSVLIYDTTHDQPLAIARGLHYANIVDASWTEDGHTLMVCSTDGYISILRFTSGELGEVYHQPHVSHITQRRNSVSSPSHVSSLVHSVPVQKTLIPPCEPGSATLQNPPRKKTRITPSPVALDNNSDVNSNSDSRKICHKRTASDAAIMAGAVHKLSLVETTTAANCTKTFAFDHKNPAPLSIPHTTLSSSNHPLQTNDQYLTPPPVMKKQKKRIQPIQLMTQPSHQQVPQTMQN